MALSEYTPVGEVRNRPVTVRTKGTMSTAPTETASSAFLRAQQAREKLGSMAMGMHVTPETTGAMAAFLRDHVTQEPVSQPEAVVTDIPADETEYNEQCPPGMDIIDQGVERYVDTVKQRQPAKTTEKPREWVNMEVKEPKLEIPKFDTLENETQFSSVSTPKVPEKQGDNADNDIKGDTEEPEFTDEELLPILDAILCKGYAYESFKLRNVNVALKSRFSWEELRALKAAESQGFVMAMGGNLALTYSMLAGALMQYGGDVFQPINEGTDDELDKHYKERFDYIRGLPAVVNDILINKEAKFNRKLAAVVKDFDRLVQAF